MLKLMDLLREGVYDKGILKAVFMAGGPGSGKSYVAKQLFGIPDKINVSVSGLKTVNSDTEFEHLLKKYGFETVGGGLDIDLWPDDVFQSVAVGDEDSETPSLRKYAKLMTKARREKYSQGRLGMIIDGTGHDYAKLAKEKKQLEKLGYDCFMVFVNTSLDVAQKRNQERARSLPPKLLQKSWKDVQHNLGKFQGLFGGNFAVVDNSKFLSSKDAAKKFGMIVKKYISKFIGKPVKNPKGKKWVKKQLILKKSGIK